MAFIKAEGKFFIFLVGFAAVSVATWAAIFSVTGLSMLYSGSLVFVAIAMSTLEFSKIIVASYLYRHWKGTAWWLKTYLTSALLLLMLITSGGIYGFLTSSYQGATIGLDKINSQSFALDQRKDNLSGDRSRLVEDIATLRAERQSTIKNRNAEIDANNISSDSTSVKFRAYRNNQVHKRYDEELTRIDNNINQYTEKLDTTNIRLSKINNEISDKKLEMIDTGVDVGPLVYMARIFDTTMDNIMNWFILVIVLVFDPLAIALVLAMNVILENRKIDTENYIKNVISEISETETKKEVDDILKNAEKMSINEYENLYEESTTESFRRTEDAPNATWKSTNVTWGQPKSSTTLLEDTSYLVSASVGNGISKEMSPVHSYTFSPRPDVGGRDDIDEDIDVETEKNYSDPEELYNQQLGDKKTLTNEEIKDIFNDAIRDERKKSVGQKSVTYEAGGSVKVDHSIQDDSDIDYSIQEEDL